MKDRSYVYNAADRQQVRHGARTAERDEDQDKADLLDVLATAAGRRLLYRWMCHCGIWDPMHIAPKVSEGPWVEDQSSRLYYSLGINRVAQFMKEQIDQVSADAFAQMWEEARLEEGRQARERAAVHLKHEEEETQEAD